MGCGDGSFFDFLDRFGDVEGVEPDPATGDRAGAEDEDDRIHRVPFEDFESPHRFGLILMLDVLEHMDDPDAALRKTASLLEPGGTVIVTVPAFRLLWTSHDDLNLHRTRYTRAELIGEMDRAGLRVERSRYFFHWVALAKLLVRLKEVLLGAEESVPRIPPTPVNETLIRLCRLDHAIGSLLRLPFGSSLLAVGVTSSGRDGDPAG